MAGRGGGVAFGLGSGDADLDDVVQEVFWLASRRLARIADLIQARGWLATVTTRVVRRKLRRPLFRLQPKMPSRRPTAPATRCA